MSRDIPRSCVRRGLRQAWCGLILAAVCGWGSEKDSVDMSFDMGITRDGTINLWPLIKYSDGGEYGTRGLDLFFSLYRHSRNNFLRRRHSHLIPLWWNTSSSEGRDVRVLSLFYPSALHYVSRRSSMNTWSLSILELAPYLSAMSVTGSKDGVFVQNNTLFLFWYKNDRLRNRRHCVFFPLLWHFGRGGRSRTAVLPLWWSGSNQTDIVGSTDDESADDESVRRYGVLFPVVWYLDARYRSFTLFPLFSHGYSPSDNSSFTILTPLVWHLRPSSDESKTMIIPLWYGGRREEDEGTVSYGVLPPFLWIFRRPSGHSFTLFPLVSNHTDSNTATHTRLTVLTPLVACGRRLTYPDYGTGFPLYTDTTSFLTFSRCCGIGKAHTTSTPR